MSGFDCAIIGGGIAGSCAAIALAQRGFRVILFEAGEFPRHKVCGEFLSPESRAVFRRLAIESQLQAVCPPEIRRAAIVSGNQTLDLNLPRGAWGISRWAMDQILWNAAKNAGVTTHAKTAIKSIEKTSDGFKVGKWDAHTVLFSTGRDARFGRPKNPRATRYIGLKAHFSGLQMPHDTVELHPFPGGYCGLNAIETGAFNVCLLARYDVFKSHTPTDFWHAVLEQNAPLAARFRGATPSFPWMATANVSFEAFAPIACDGVMRAGDAAGYIHPFAGDGMAIAARAGELAAAVLGAQLQDALSPDEAARLYQAAWNREFAHRLGWAAQVHRLLLRPLLAHFAVSIGQLVPELPQKVVRSTRG